MFVNLPPIVSSGTVLLRLLVALFMAAAIPFSGCKKDKPNIIYRAPMSAVSGQWTLTTDGLDEGGINVNGEPNPGCYSVSRFQAGLLQMQSCHYGNGEAVYQLPFTLSDDVEKLEVSIKGTRHGHGIIFWFKSGGHEVKAFSDGFKANGTEIFDCGFEISSGSTSLCSDTESGDRYFFQIEGMTDNSFGISVYETGGDSENIGEDSKFTLQELAFKLYEKK